MNKQVFNLRQHRKAFYEGAKGYMVPETRSMSNALKKNVDKGMGPHEAKFKAIEDYNDVDDKGKWALENAGSDDSGPKPYFTAGTPAAEKIKKKK